jgi:ribosomal protein S18
MDDAFKWLHENGGIESESDYPYKGRKETCKFDKSKAKVQVADWKDIAKGDENAMKDAISSYGPISVAIHANGL